MGWFRFCTHVGPRRLVGETVRPHGRYLEAVPARRKQHPQKALHFDETMMPTSPMDSLPPHSLVEEQHFREQLCCAERPRNAPPGGTKARLVSKLSSFQRWGRRDRGLMLLFVVFRRILLRKDNMLRVRYCSDDGFVQLRRSRSYPYVTTIY